MDKVLNRRYLLGVAICLLAGAATGGALVHSLVLQIVIPIAVAAVGILLLFLKRKFLFFALLAFALGAAILSADYAVGRADLHEGYYVFQGRVCEVSEKNVLFDSAALDGENVRGKVKGKREDFAEATTGQVVRVFVKISPYDVDFFDGYSASLFNDRIYHEITPYGETTVVGEKFTVFEKIRNRIADPLYRTLAAEDAGISESLLFGDKSNLSAYDHELIEGIGMSHIFAVSGLHVGFLVASVVYLLKKLRAKYWVRIVVTALVLLSYGFLTGFPAGLKRAAIMALLYLAAPEVREKPDGLTSLGAACFIIVLTNPREIFDVGLLMSASAVAGILLFTTPISRGLRRLFHAKRGKRVFDMVALTVGANLMLLPILFNVFGSVAPYAVVSNPIILPIVTVTYVYLVVVAFLTAIIPSLGILFFPVKYPFIVIRAIGSLLYSLPYATVSVPSIGLFAALYIVGLIILSRVNKLPLKWKAPFAAVFLATSLVGFFL